MSVLHIGAGDGNGPPSYLLASGRTGGGGVGISPLSSEMGGAADGAGLAGTEDVAGSLGLADSTGFAGSNGTAGSTGFTAEVAGFAVLLVAAGPPLSGEEEHPTVRVSTPAKIRAEQRNDRQKTSGMRCLLRRIR